MGFLLCLRLIYPEQHICTNGEACKMNNHTRFYLQRRCLGQAWEVIYVSASLSFAPRANKVPCLKKIQWSLPSSKVQDEHQSGKLTEQLKVESAHHMILKQLR